VGGWTRLRAVARAFASPATAPRPPGTPPTERLSQLLVVCAPVSCSALQSPEASEVRATEPTLGALVLKVKRVGDCLVVTVLRLIPPTISIDDARQRRLAVRPVRDRLRHAELRRFSFHVGQARALLRTGLPRANSACSRSVPLSCSRTKIIATHPSVVIEMSRYMIGPRPGILDSDSVGSGA
jgi:hypothetical protein